MHACPGVPRAGPRSCPGKCREREGKGAGRNEVAVAAAFAAAVAGVAGVGGAMRAAGRGLGAAVAKGVRTNCFL